MPQNIPNPDRLIANYPQGEAAAIKKEIGGRVNADWITNTCAIRLSRSFNKSDAEVPGNYPGMNTVTGGDKKQYAYRVAEFRKFLTSKYGNPTLKARGNGASEPPASFLGKKGIICFIDCGWTDASGHLDLWDGKKVVGHGYFDKAKEIHLWCPPAPPPPPAVPGPALTKWGVVFATSLNVRDQPTNAGRVIGSYKANTKLPILESRGGFYRVGAGQWVTSAYVRLL